MKELSKEFFARDTVSVAKNLLGKVMIVKGVSGRIVEVEAYGQDPASHAFKKTERSALMYETYGHVYVYLIYGMYYCINFTTEMEGKPGAVLVRAVEPLSGVKKMVERRGTEKVEHLCSGPGKLCIALGIDKQHNGLKLGEKVRVFDDGFKVEKMGISSRVGIKDALDLKWRFYIESNKFVSKV